MNIARLVGISGEVGYKLNSNVEQYFEKLLSDIFKIISSHEVSYALKQLLKYGSVSD